MTSSIGVGAFPSLQGRPEVGVGRSLGYFQASRAGRVPLGTQKWSSLRTEIIFRRHKADNEADPFSVVE